MILGIGTDIVEVNRFESWKTFSKTQLSKVFTEQELIDCTQEGILQAEKLAVRFAAKEASYKALSATLIKLGYTNISFSFMFACSLISVIKTTWGLPILDIKWSAFNEKIGQKLPPITTHLSLSDEKNHVVACVIFER